MSKLVKERDLKSLACNELAGSNPALPRPLKIKGNPLKNSDQVEKILKIHKNNPNACILWMLRYISKLEDDLNAVHLAIGEKPKKTTYEILKEIEKVD